MQSLIVKPEAISSLATAAARPLAASQPIRVMIVDDAVVARSLETRWVEDQGDMTIVATLRSGREAVEQIERCAPDVVVLDIDRVLELASKTALAA